MKLNVASWNNGGADWNAEAEETKLRSYIIDHQFNKPARCILTLADVDGSIIQKYNADANDVYLGTGKITLEDPTGTDIFYGRAKRASGDSAERTLTLECADWLDQLNDEIVTYDMREKLSGDLRQSYAWPDHDGAHVDVAQNAAGTYYFYDDNMNWANDAYNTMKLVFTTGMAGSNSWKVPPYTVTVSEPIDGIDNDNNAPDRVWVEDGVKNSQRDNDGPYTVTYSHRIWVGHNTPSDFYVHDSISGARVTIAWRLTGTGASATLTVYDNNGASYIDIGDLDHGFGTMRNTFEVPVQYVPYVVDANGLAKVQIQVGCDGVNNATIDVDYLDIEVDVETTGYSTAVTIDDTFATNKLEVATDLTAAATRIWPMVPYCIVRPTYQHLDSAETPGALITDGGGDKSGTGPDPVIALTAAATIEHTTGYSTTQYKDKTRLQMLQALAAKDASVFWVTLGGTTVTYKKTFGADTMQLTDGKVESWQSLQDYNTMINSVDVYGARIGDYEIYQQSQNAASIAKFLSTKSKVIRNTGVVSDYDASVIGTALTAKENDISQMVACTIAGNTATAAHATTIKLGEIVEITSSYLWPGAAAKDYIVSRFVYDSAKHQTYLTMYPKASTGERAIEFEDPRIKQLERKIEAEGYVPDPVTHEVS